MARPRYKPTDSDRQTVEVMAAAGINQDRIARCIGNKGIDGNTLRRHFRRELDVSADKANALVATQVFKAAGRGEAWACCFWLKCRADWKERQVTEHTGADGQPIFGVQQFRDYLAATEPKDDEATTP